MNLTKPAIQQKERSEMPTKFIRFIAALAVIISIAGNTGVASANRGTPPSASSQNLIASTLASVVSQRPLRVPESQPLNIPALMIPPASSLGVQFVHVATAANIDAHTTLIDHPLTNGNPGALLIVTPDWNPGGGAIGAYQNHYIGVFYNITRGQWGIYNEDGTAMSVGEAFNVIIPTTNTFVQTASIIFSSTTINNPLTNNNPNAVLLVTPIWNPGGGVSGTNANFPISVQYNNIFNRWTIINQSGGTMPTGTSFNVFVPTTGAGVFVHTTAVSGTGSIYTIIDNALTTGHPNAIVFITPNLNPGGLLDEHPTGVFYGNGYWKIFNRDGANMPINTSFDVLVLVPRSDIFVHTATAGNSDGISYTRIDNALTNAPGNTNAIVFTTPNFNPGGGSGVFNNHNISVAYSYSGWAISNQDNAAILPNAAFNVLVPNPDASVFVHKATSANISLNGTTLDYPLTNGNPNAIILVTPNYDPGDVGGTLDNHPIGVYYIGGKWEILNQDTMAMPVGAAFNVFVPTAGAGVFVHVATPLNTGANATFIDNPLTNGNPNAIILVTPNYNPGGSVSAVPANFPIGVGYNNDINKWAVFNGSSVTMPVGAAFNVYVVGNYKLTLPLIMR
jgi:hypothetical protein